MKVDTILIALLVLFLMFILFGGRVSGFTQKAAEREAAIAEAVAAKKIFVNIK